RGAAAGRAGRLLRVGRAVGARAAAELGVVAVAAGEAARGAVRQEAIGRAGVARPVAELGDVADARGGPARRPGLLQVGRAGRARAAAVLGDVAVAGRGPARRARWGEGVRRTDVRRAIAGFRHVAGAGRRAADRPRFEIRRAVCGRAGAVLGGVAVAHRGPTDDAARGQRVRGTGELRAVADLVRVADAGRCPTLGPASLRRLRTDVADARADRAGVARTVAVRATLDDR